MRNYLINSNKKGLNKYLRFRSKMVSMTAYKFYMQFLKIFILVKVKRGDLLPVWAESHGNVVFINKQRQKKKRMIIIAKFLVAMGICMLESTLIFAQRNSTSSSKITVNIEGTSYRNIHSSIIKPIGIGEKVPNIIFRKILNYRTSSLRLSDLKGKLIILDFWHTHCASCIASFPKVERLNKTFEGKAFILMVGFNYKPGEVENFIIKRKGSKAAMTLPTAVENDEENDNFIRKLFPSQGMPHLVWIDKDGIFRAATDARDLTEQNIKAFLTGKSVSLLTKREYLHRIDPCKEAFLIGKDILQRKFRSGSLFSDFNDTLDWSPRLLDKIQCDTNKWHILNVNQPVVTSYKNAYSVFFPFLKLDHFNKRIIIETDFPDKFYKKHGADFDMDEQSYREYLDKNHFSYELILPRNFSREDVFRHIINDFDSYFQIESKMEIRKVKCLALVKTKNGKEFRSLGGPQQLISSVARDSIQYKNYPISDFITALNDELRSVIIINETGYEGNLNISTFGIIADDVELYKSSLAMYGLDLIEVYRYMPMLVLKDMSRR